MLQFNYFRVIGDLQLCMQDLSTNKKYTVCVGDVDTNKLAYTTV